MSSASGGKIGGPAHDPRGQPPWGGSDAVALQCTGSRAADRFGVSGRSVADDDLDVRMAAKPCFEGFRLAVDQDVNSFVRYSVDNKKQSRSSPRS